jgi:hypothetical protein
MYIVDHFQELQLGVSPATTFVDCASGDTRDAAAGAEIAPSGHVHLTVVDSVAALDIAQGDHKQA